MLEKRLTERTVPVRYINDWTFGFKIIIFDYFLCQLMTTHNPHKTFFSLSKLHRSIYQTTMHLNFPENYTGNLRALHCNLDVSSHYSATPIIS